MLRVEAIQWRTIRHDSNRLERCQELTFGKCLTPCILRLARAARYRVSGTCEEQVPDTGCDNSTVRYNALKYNHNIRWKDSPRPADFVAALLAQSV